MRVFSVCTIVAVAAVGACGDESSAGTADVARDSLTTDAAVPSDGSVEDGTPDSAAPDSATTDSSSPDSSATGSDGAADSTAADSAPDDTAAGDSAADTEPADVGPPSFTFTVTEAVSAQFGAPGQVVLTLARENLADLVSVTASGVPTGVHLAPSPVVFGGATTEVTASLTVDADVVAGAPATITWTATSGDLVHTATTTLTLVDAPTFSIKAAQSLAFYPGDHDEILVDLERTSGFAADVTVDIEPIAGITTTAVTLHGSETRAFVPIDVALDVTPGQRLATVTASGGGFVREKVISLQPYAAPTFDLDEVGGDITVAAGASVPVSIAVTRDSQDGATALALTIQDLPSGVSAEATTVTVDITDSTATFVLHAASGAAPATAQAKVSGVAIGPDLDYTASTTFSVSLVPPPPFVLGLESDTLVVEQGGTASVGVDVVRDASFTGAVAIDTLSSFDDVAMAAIDIPSGQTHATLTFSADPDALLDLPSTFAVRGSGGGSSQPLSLALRVRPPASALLDDAWGFHGVHVLDAPSVGSTSLVAAACAADGCLVLGGRGVLTAYDDVGALRPDFGDAGTLQFFGMPNPNALALEADGAPWVVGVSSGTTLKIGHTLADGAPDVSFNGGDVLAIDISAARFGVNHIALASDGGLWIVGQDASDGVAARTTPDGAFDTSFGGSGRVAVDLGQTEQLRGVVPRGTGIVVAGHQEQPGTRFPFIARLAADGSLDPSFSGDGIAMLPMGCDVGDVVNLVDLGGALAVIGTACERVAVWKVSDAGVVDATFGGDGVADPFATSQAYDAVVDRLGGLVVLSKVGGTFALARLDAAGAADLGFGTAGVETLVFGPGGATPSAIALDARGGFLVTGQIYPRGVIARFRPPS